MNDERRWMALHRKLVSESIKIIAFDFRKHDIDLLIIKGIVVSLRYPPTFFRPFNDIDIAVAEECFPLASEILQQSNPKFPVDLHNGLRHLDLLPWDILMRRSDYVVLDGTRVRTLSSEDHLRVVSTHWLNDGGVNKERLWDIYYSVENRPEDFDWSKCLDCVSETRRGWVITTIGLAHKYLGLNINDLPFKDEALRIPKWVTDTLEREWAIGEPIRPLQTCTRDPKLFLRQLRRRIPPNPIQATIQMEAPIDDRGRAMLQVRNVIRRAGPSVERISSVLRGRMQRKSK